MRSIIKLLRIWNYKSSQFDRQFFYRREADQYKYHKLKAMENAIQKPLF